MKDRLPAVEVAGPFVERQNARELAQIAHFQQVLLGQIVDHLPGHQAPHPARGEVQPRQAALRSIAQLDDRSGVLMISQPVTSMTSAGGTESPIVAANRVANSSLASTRRCCGLLRNLTTYR